MSFGSFLTNLINPIGAVSSLYGMFSSAAAQQAAQQQEQQLLQQAQMQLNQQYEGALNNNNAQIWQQAGQGGDAIRAMGRRLPRPVPYI